MARLARNASSRRRSTSPTARCPIGFGPGAAKWPAPIAWTPAGWELPTRRSGRALFDEGLAVRVGPYREHTSQDVLSYETTEMADLVADLVRNRSRQASATICRPSRACSARGAWSSWSGRCGTSIVRSSVKGGILRNIETAVQGVPAEQAERVRGGWPALLATRRALPHAAISSRTGGQADPQPRRSRIDATYGSHEQTRRCPSPTKICRSQFDFHQVLGGDELLPDPAAKAGCGRRPRALTRPLHAER